MTRSVRIAAVFAIALATGASAWIGPDLRSWPAAGIGAAILIGFLSATRVENGRRGSIRTAITGALLAGVFAALIAWSTDDILGAAWPFMKRLSRSGLFLFSLIAVVGLWELIPRSDASAPRPRA